MAKPKPASDQPAEGQSQPAQAEQPAEGQSQPDQAAEASAEGQDQPDRAEQPAEGQSQPAQAAEASADPSGRGHRPGLKGKRGGRLQVTNTSRRPVTIGAHRFPPPAKVDGGHRPRPVTVRVGPRGELRLRSHRSLTVTDAPA